MTLFATNWGNSLGLDYTISDNILLKPFTAYREVDDRFTVDEHTPLSISTNLLQLPSNHLSPELRLSGLLGEDFSYTVGGFYFKSHIKNPGRTFNLNTFDQVANDKTDTETQAVFSHMDYQLTEKISLIAGLRYTLDEKVYVFNRSQGQSTPYGLLGLFDTIKGLDGATGKFDDDRTDWRVAANLQANSELMHYTQVVTGYKGGGINPRPFYPTQVVAFEPETKTS